MIELRLIRNALALGRHGNFARAAAALKLSQPALSRSIAALEAQLGVPLFDRNRRGAEPTAFGQVLLARGATLLGDAAGLRRELALLAGLELGTLAVGVGPYALNEVTGSIVGTLSKRHPRLQISVLSIAPLEVVKGVLTGQFDLGVAAIEGTEPDDRIAFEPLPSHPILLVSRPGHPLVRQRRLEAADVLRFPLVSTAIRRAALRELLKQHGQGHVDEATGEYLPPINVNSLDIARQIARQSDAVFPATRGMVREDIDAGHLVQLDFRLPLMTTQYGFIYLKHRTLSPAALLFMNLAREAERKLALTDTAAMRRRRARKADARL
jgi:DNA-binding transcriptional LysR family regulator